MKKVLLDLIGPSQFLRYLAIKLYLEPAIQSQTGDDPDAEVDEDALEPYPQFLMRDVFKETKLRITAPIWDKILDKYQDRLPDLDYRYDLILRDLPYWIEHQNDRDALAIAANELQHKLDETEKQGEQERKEQSDALIKAVAGGAFQIALVVIGFFGNEVRAFVGF